MRFKFSSPPSCPQEPWIHYVIKDSLDFNVLWRWGWYGGIHLRGNGQEQGILGQEKSVIKSQQWGTFNTGLWGMGKLWTQSNRKHRDPSWWLTQSPLNRKRGRKWVRSHRNWFQSFVWRVRTTKLIYMRTYILWQRSLEATKYLVYCKSSIQFTSHFLTILPMESD